MYELRHRWRDGTTHVALEPLELIPGLPIGLGKLAKSHFRRRLTRRRAA